MLINFLSLPRKLRLDYEGGIDHVMNRGDRKEAINLDDPDRQRFVETRVDKDLESRPKGDEQRAERVVRLRRGNDDDLALDCRATNGLFLCRSYGACLVGWWRFYKHGAPPELNWV